MRSSSLVGALGTALILAGCATTAAGPDTGTADVTRAPSGDMAHLVAVTLGEDGGFDHLVLEFADRVPGYTVGYRPLPARADASGFEVPLPGANAMVQLTLNPATGQGWGGGQPTYAGPSIVAGTTAVVTEVKSAGDFEATLTWVAGLRSTVPFRVLELESPPRLVVDFQH